MEEYDISAYETRKSMTHSMIQRSTTHTFCSQTRPTRRRHKDPPETGRIAGSIRTCPRSRCRCRSRKMLEHPPSQEAAFSRRAVASNLPPQAWRTPPLPVGVPRKHPEAITDARQYPRVEGNGGAREEEYIAYRRERDGLISPNQGLVLRKGRVVESVTKNKERIKKRL